MKCNIQLQYMSYIISGSNTFPIELYDGHFYTEILTNKQTLPLPFLFITKLVQCMIMTILLYHKA